MGCNLAFGCWIAELKKLLGNVPSVSGPPGPLWNQGSTHRARLVCPYNVWRCHFVANHHKEPCLPFCTMLTHGRHWVKTIGRHGISQCRAANPRLFSRKAALVRSSSPTSALEAATFNPNPANICLPRTPSHERQCPLVGMLTQRGEQMT